jgi:hypothetical protein
MYLFDFFYLTSFSLTFYNKYDKVYKFSLVKKLGTMQKGKIFNKNIFTKLAFYGLDTYGAGTETATCQK